MIPPSKQSGSWVLKDYEIVTGKLGAEVEEYFPVEIYSFQSRTRVYSGNISRMTACRAAFSAVVDHFGQTSPEADEFRQNYPCSAPNQQGYKMQDDLDDVSTQELPAWIRR